MGGKGVGDIASRTARKTGISPRTAHRRGKQFTCRAARGGVKRNSAAAPAQSDAPYFEPKVSSSASSAGGSCSVRRGPAKSRAIGLGLSYEANASVLALSGDAKCAAGRPPLRLGGHPADFDSTP